MAQEIKQRIEWLDTARGICAFCVLLAHSGCCPKLYLDIYTPFFLMLFFLISGYLFKQQPLFESIKKTLNGIILPYFALCFIQIAIGFDSIQAALHGNYVLIFLKVKDVLLGKSLWFVACLIMVQIYYILIQNSIYKITFLKKIKELQLILGILLLFSCYLIRNENYETSYWYFDTALFALSYFIIGNYFKEIAINLNSITTKSKILSLLAFIAFAILAVLGQKLLDVEFHVATNYYKSPLYFFLISWIGIFSVIYVCHNFKLPQYLKLLGQNSLLLFAFNGKTKAIVVGLFDHFNIRDLIQNDYFYSLLICFLQGYLIILLALIVNRYFPQIVGKKQWIK